jgi:hypothetical protein
LILRQQQTAATVVSFQGQRLTLN